MSVRSIHATMLCSMLAVTVVACGRSSETYTARPESAAGNVGSAGKTATSVPASVDAVGTHGEDLYDQVKADNWARAVALLDSLRTDVAQLPADVPAEAKASLAALMDSLAADIAAKRRTQAMVDANQVTYMSAQLARRYSTTTPVQVMLLDYEGRELEIWSAMRDPGKLAATKRDLRRTWDEIRPEVEKRNAAQAAHTEALVARIDRAETPSELGKLATPFLDEVDLLEKVFATHQ